MNNSDSPVILLENASISNGENVVVHELDMRVDPGEFVYITGRVGSGKSSIIHALTAETPLEGGSGEVCGYSLNTLRRKDIPLMRRKLGVVFQDFRLLMEKNVEDNLAYVLKATGCRDKDRIAERVREVLEAVGMETKAHRMPHQLSGGEQQRICIARAILNNPGLILADEPTGNLDDQTAEDIMQLLRKINAEGAAVLMITHRAGLIERYPGRVFICQDEKCVEKK